MTEHVHAHARTCAHTHTHIHTHLNQTELFSKALTYPGIIVVQLDFGDRSITVLGGGYKKFKGLYRFPFFSFVSDISETK